MAVGKNKRQARKNKGRKIIDPFSKKEWYDIKAPNLFRNRQVGRTLVNRSQGTKLASDSLRGRIFEVSLADLNNDEDQSYRVIRLKCEEVQNRDLLCSFHGLRFTTDKLKSLIRKWHTLIEATIDVKTTDNFVLRVFVIAFTKKRPNQTRKTSYAQTSQIRAIRQKMVEIVHREASSGSLMDFVEKLIPEVIKKEIEKSTHGIYPLQNVYVRKIKILRAPKTDIGKLMEMHGDSKKQKKEETGKQVERQD